ncbi:MAG: hypothetical protein F4082_04980, partial [Gammaproteobacteria bacterium]|nr:hypothetical protein [Gammaproteobacteria bacterium]
MLKFSLHGRVDLPSNVIVEPVLQKIGIVKPQSGNLECLGEQMESGLWDLFANQDYPTTIVRVGSAFVVYFMYHEPVCWSDISRHNDAERDVRYRKALIDSGVFHFPVTTKQGSISFAHIQADIDEP